MTEPTKRELIACHLNMKVEAWRRLTGRDSTVPERTWEQRTPTDQLFFLELADVFEQAILAAEQRATERAQIADPTRMSVETARSLMAELGSRNATVAELEAQVAALREALRTQATQKIINGSNGFRYFQCRVCRDPNDYSEPATFDLVEHRPGCAYGDTAAAAAAYTQRIEQRAREKALEEAATWLHCEAEGRKGEVWQDTIARLAAAIRALATPPATEEAK